MCSKDLCEVEYLSNTKHCSYIQEHDKSIIRVLFQITRC